MTRRRTDAVSAYTDVFVRLRYIQHAARTSWPRLAASPPPRAAVEPAAAAAAAVAVAVNNIYRAVVQRPHYAINTKQSLGSVRCARVLARLHAHSHRAARIPLSVWDDWAYDSDQKRDVDSLTPQSVRQTDFEAKLGSVL